MKSTTYSEKTLDHFRNPRNVGVLEGDDVAVGRVGNTVCGDLMEIYIRIRDDVITEIRFQTFGCGSAVATSSMITELVMGMTLDDALRVTRNDVADALDGLPPVKMHCSNLAADALHNAIENWRSGVRLDPTDPSKVPPKSCGPSSQDAITGADEFVGRGYYDSKPELEDVKGLRILVVDTGPDSLELALKLTEATGRVIFATTGSELRASDDLKARVRRSDIKLLFLSKVMQVSGEGEVEKVRIQDLDEDEEYELVVDSLIVPE